MVEALRGVESLNTQNPSSEGYTRMCICWLFQTISKKFLLIIISPQTPRNIHRHQEIFTNTKKYSQIPRNIHKY